MATSFQVTFDSADVGRLMRFWAATLGYKEQDPPEGFDSWEDWLRSVGVPESEWDTAGALVDPDGILPRLYFQKVPEGKTAKNRVHLDVNVGGPPGTSMEDRRRKVDSEAERLVGLGASQIRVAEERGEYWIVMGDPEGNEFCLQ
jgi:hypothetical protein